MGSAQDESAVVPDARPTAAVVFNPVNVPVAELKAAVTAAEGRYGWMPTRWFETTTDDPGGQAARVALDADPIVVIAAGGDGTVRAVAEQVAARDVSLALIPSGTGNLLARNLRLALSDLQHSVDTAFSGSNRSIDVANAELRRIDGTTSSHAFLVMAGIGLDARMATSTNAALKRKIGWLAYVDPIARSILGNRRLRMHYRLNGGTVRSMQAHTVIAGNCGTLTGNLLLLPEAVIDDGLLDVVTFRPKGAWGWTRIGTRLTVHGVLHRSRRGRRIARATPQLRGLRYVQGARFEAWFDNPQQIELDGDSFGEVTGVTLTVRQRGITIRVPRHSV